MIIDVNCTLIYILHTCSGPPSASGGNPSPRFVLYDTKYGEGFNLQREAEQSDSTVSAELTQIRLLGKVYPRAGWVVAQANKAGEQRCCEADLDLISWTKQVQTCQTLKWWEVSWRRSMKSADQSWMANVSWKWENMQNSDQIQSNDS